jgi:hypothetical protein
MRVRFQDLSPDTAAQLKRVAQARGLGKGTVFIDLRRGWLLWVGLIALATGLVSAWALAYGTEAGPLPADALLPWAGLVGLVYGTVALADYVRVLLAELKPFVLLTPFNLVRCRGSQHPIELFRLPEANAFQCVEEYNGATWQGQSYVFTFDGGHQIRFTLRQKQAIEAANATLALARNAARGERLPDLPIREIGDLRPGHIQALNRRSALRQLLDPASETWLVMFLLFVIAGVVWAIFR